MSQRLSVIINHLQPSLPVEQIHASGVKAQQGKKVMNVCITGAAGQIGYSLIFMVAKGNMLGYDQPIELRLLDLPGMEKKLQGLEAEILDCAFPLVTKIVCTTEYKTAFTDLDVALLVGARPRGPGMQRGDLLSANAKIFSEQGKALNQYCPKVKVVVVGNPANTNALIAMTNAPNIPRENFTALTRLDQNRAVSQIASRLKVPITNVDNIIIWGNHSKTQYPDVNHGTVTLANGQTVPIRKAVQDDKWLNGQFLSCVQDRGAEIIKLRGLSSAASAANATCDHIRDWVLGTKKGQVVSMGVVSDGSYGVPKGLIYSFPVTCENGKWKIVQGLKIDEFSKQKMIDTAKELLEEKQLAGL